METSSDVENKVTVETSVVGRMATALTVASALVTIGLSVGNYFVKLRVDAAERELKERAEKVEESKERIARYEYVHSLLSNIDNANKTQRTLAINICRLALTAPEQNTLFNELELSPDRKLAETGREGAATIVDTTTEGNAVTTTVRPVQAARAEPIFPRYVTPDMIKKCQTRGGNDKCGLPGLSVTLGGTEYKRGIVFTQSLPDPAAAEISIPRGAKSFAFTVGNYWLGTDCGGQRPMIMSVFVDGVRRWGPRDTSQISTDTITISAHAQVLVLRGDSGDGDVRCDDSVWVNARFEGASS